MSDRWLRYLEFFRRDPRRDFDDEMHAHLDHRVADLTARGLTPERATAQARAEFGDANEARERTVSIDERIIRRRARAEWFADISRDARVALRSLRNSPSWSVTAVLSAALGIGVTAAIVSASYATLVRPLPFTDADRLVAIYSEYPARGYSHVNISWPDFVSWRDETRAFSNIGIWTWNTMTISDDAGANEAERLDGAEVSANLFPMLGVQPMMGRSFAPEEEIAGRHFVVLLSHRLWTRRFGSDSSIVGKSITLDGHAWTVVGVMPPRFNFPDRGELWIPFSTNPATERRGNRGYAGAIGRLRPGVTLQQAEGDLHRIDAALARQFPDESAGWRAQLLSLREDLVGELEAPLRVFLAAVAVVLLMVCANLANLLLARGATRAREMAMRTALGASRVRLVRQLLTESLIITTLGGSLGVLIAALGVQLLRLAFPDGQAPYYVDLRLDVVSLAIVALIAGVTGVLCGVLPAVRCTGVDLNAALRDGGRAAGAGPGRSRMRAALVAGELALSVVLMIGALLLVRSYRNLQGTDFGFDERGILTARYTLPKNAGYPTRTDVEVFTDRLIERLRSVPGVTFVGAAQGIPFSGWDVKTEVDIEGAPKPKRGEELDSHFQFVTPDFFSAMGVRLVRGRWFAKTDRDSLHPVVLVNEQFVATGLRGANPLGKRIMVAGANDSLATIVGVVSDYRHYRLPTPMGPAVYFPNAVWPARQMTLAIRTTHEDPHTLVPMLRDAVRELDRRVALYQVQTMDDVVSRSLWRQRLQGNVLSIFAAMALVLACIGLYGVIAFAVAQRTRELGVRIALGATRANVLRLVLGESGRLVFVGVVLGLAVAWFAVRLLGALLYGVEAHDVATFVAVPLILGAVSLVAALIPSRRAVRVDPMLAMRAE